MAQVAIFCDANTSRDVIMHYSLPHQRIQKFCGHIPKDYCKYSEKDVNEKVCEFLVASLVSTDHTEKANWRKNVSRFIFHFPTSNVDSMVAQLWA